MSAVSDDDLRAAAPLLAPLLSLAGSPNLKWTTKSSSGGYTVSEIPSAPALGIPLKCFRTQYTIDADIAAFARHVTDIYTTQQCDPTLKEIRVLSMSDGGSRTQLYAAHTSPSPWVVSPRDFCISSASVLTTEEQLHRVFPDAPPSSNFLPESADTSPANRQHSLVFLQNSFSTTDATCPPAKDSGINYIRGYVHCYGYVAVPDPSAAGKVHVTNLCCVDACGRIPKWIVAAAVNQNTQKLKRLSLVVERAAKQQREVGTAGAAAATAAPAETTPGASPCQETTETQGIQRETVQQGPLSPPAPCSERDHNAHDVEEGMLSNDSLVGTQSTMPSTVKARSPPPPPMPQSTVLRDNISPASAPLVVESPDMRMPALTGSLSPTPVPAPTPPSPPQSPPAAVRSPVICGAPAHQHQQSLPRVSPFAQQVQPLAHLASANGWHTLREVDGVELANLTTLPQSLSVRLPNRSRDDGSALCVALRVTATVRCSLDTAELLLRSPARAPDIDPELVRLVAAPSSTSSTHKNTKKEEGVDFNSQAGALPTSHVRHLEFNAGTLFTHAWDVLLRCTDGELSPFEGGQLGFQTPGVPASTYVWFGTSKGESADGPLGGSALGGSPVGSSARGFQRLDARVCGVVAVAVPRSAAAIRLAHYVLFDPPPPASRFVRRPSSRFTTKGSKRVTEGFLTAVGDWMRQRMQRLRRLCEAHAVQQAADAMAPLEKEPLLQDLYNVHRTVEAARATAADATVHRVGDVVVHCTQLPGTDDTGASASMASPPPPLYVLTLSFPCSLRHLMAYMTATPARSRYTMDERVVLCDELPSSPGLRSLYLEVREEGADALLSPTAFSFLEAIGTLRGPDARLPTLVLSRLNCLHPQRDEDEEETTGGAALRAAVGRRGDDVRQGLLYCSGWVAFSANDKEGSEGEAEGERAATRAGGRRPMQRLVDNSRGRFGESPPRNAGFVADAVSPESTVRRDAITVTQYSCVRVEPVSAPASERSETLEAALQLGMVKREAMLLQRFRDSVCAWRS